METNRIYISFLKSLLLSKDQYLRKLQEVAQQVSFVMRFIRRYLNPSEYFSTVVALI